MSDLLEEAREIAFNSLFNLLPLNFCWVDKDGIILGSNQRMIESIGRNFDLIGRHTSEVASPIAWKNTQIVLKTGKSLTCEEIHMKEDGTESYFICMKSPIKSSNGDILGVVNVAIDITDKKRMEIELIKAEDQAKIAKRTKSEFLANMLHDFRTPFTGIVSISQYLGVNEDDTTKKSFLKDIEVSGQSLLKHINDILEYTQLNKQTELVREEFDTVELFNELYHMLLPAANHKNIDLKFFIYKDFPIKLIGDKLKTTQVLLHILSNAIKFTDKGSAELYVSYMDGIAQFIITDTGIGIPKDKHEVIFEPLSRLTPSHAGIYEGKGLGLTIVKEILDQIDGQYQINSTLGQGTVFKIVIPYQISLLDKVKQEFREENVISITNTNSVRRMQNYKKD
jgi:two-component system, OmpR family, aerobic respiration control sensor histidine kinase ArcB